jgi:hypothetical protein
MFLLSPQTRWERHYSYLATGHSILHHQDTQSSSKTGPRNRSRCGRGKIIRAHYLRRVQ